VALRKFAVSLGLAFQIQDDLLNLTGDPRRYGKEIGGDLWEGKHTLILLHMLRAASPSERRRAHAVLAKARPLEGATASRASSVWADSAATTARLATLADELRRTGELSARGRTALRRALGPRTRHGAYKTDADVALLRALIDKYDSIAYARRVARHWAGLASARRAALRAWMPPSVHDEFLRQLTDFVVERTL
jgi:geranylgeranyl diphosphate synthase type II